MTKYRIIDKQIAGRYFADGAEFESKEAVRDQLIDYHTSAAFEDMGDKEVIKNMSLNDILDFGEWDIEEIKQ